MPRQTVRLDQFGSSIDSMKADLEEMTDPQRIGQRLDGVLYELLADLKASTPVRTGLLKGSGYATSQLDGDEWVGEVVFGTGLDYAVYVMNKEPNEFDAIVTAYEPRFEAALWKTDG